MNTLLYLKVAHLIVKTKLKLGLARLLKKINIKKGFFFFFLAELKIFVNKLVHLQV